MELFHLYESALYHISYRRRSTGKAKAYSHTKDVVAEALFIKQLWLILHGDHRILLDGCSPVGVVAVYPVAGGNKALDHSVSSKNRRPKGKPNKNGPAVAVETKGFRGIVLASLFY